MTAAVYHLPDDVSVQRRQRWLAVGLSVLLHGLLALFLLGNRMSTPPPPPQIQTLETRLITLPPPPGSPARCPEHASSNSRLPWVGSFLIRWTLTIGGCRARSMADRQAAFWARQR